MVEVEGKGREGRMKGEGGEGQAYLVVREILVMRKHWKSAPQAKLASRMSTRRSQ